MWKQVCFACLCLFNKPGTQYLMQLEYVILNSSIPYLWISDKNVHFVSSFSWELIKFRSGIWIHFALNSILPAHCNDFGKHLANSFSKV